MTPFFRAKLLRSPARQGFTLIELLVAIAVSSIVVLFLGTMVASALKSSTSTSNSLLALSAANSAMDLVADDLKTLSSPASPTPLATLPAGVVSPPYEYLQALPDPNFLSESKLSTIKTYLNANPPALLMLNSSSAEDSLNSSQAAVGGAVAAANTGSEPRAVCYQLAYQDPINPTTGTAPLFGMYRTVENATNTFATFLGQSDLYTQWNAFVGAALATPPSSSFIVGNVVDFQIVFYACRTTTNANPPVAVTGAQLTTPYPVYSTATAGTGKTIRLNNTGITTTTTAASLDSSYNHGPMIYAEVTIVVLDNIGAQQLSAGAIRKLSTAEALYGHTLTRRIPLSQSF